MKPGSSNLLWQKYLRHSRFWALGLVLIAIACAKQTPIAQSLQSVASGRDIKALEHNHSIRCVVDRVIGPPSYRFRDIGKPDVIRLSKAQLALVRGIAHYVTSDTLRFAFIGKEFIVYDAVYGPCAGGAPGYWVLNGGCNEYFSPTDDFNTTHGVDSCWGPRRPWIKNDSGSGTQSWSNYDAWR